jgi:hypothetical protein
MIPGSVGDYLQASVLLGGVVVAARVLWGMLREEPAYGKHGAIAFPARREMDREPAEREYRVPA